MARLLPLISPAMSRRAPKRSLRGQFLWRTSAACLLAVLLSSAVALAWTVMAARARFTSQIEHLAEAVAPAALVAVERRDARLAEQALAGLAGNPLIASARIERADGAVVAAVAPATDAPVGDDGASEFVSVRRHLQRNADDAALGSIVIAVRPGAMTDPMVRDGIVLATASGVGAFVGLLMLWRSRDALVEPAERLASSIDQILSLGNLRDRPERPAFREFAALADVCDGLLTRLEQHNRAVDDLKSQGTRQLERQAQAFRTELEEQRQAIKDLVLAKAAAEESSLAKSAFLFNMSHELRTPLNAIMGYSELLREGAADDDAEQRAKDTAKILAAGRHLLTLINAVLDLSKIEAGRVELELETMDVSQLLYDVVSTSESLATAQRNTLTLEMSDGLGTMHSDPTKIRQILLNLVGNASKFTTDGAITIEAVRERELADWIVIRVKDTGIGMSAEEQAGLFREFKQGRAARERPDRGTGLGLAISQALCQLLGGTISVESTPAVGSTFTVRLPARATAVQDGRGQAVKAAGSPAKSPATNEDPARPAVLVIDHDAGARELVRRVTTRLGYQLIEAADASEGYRLAVVREPVAIVLEVVLAGQNGWGLLERLTRLPILASPPVIVVSVSGDEARSRSLGATAHFAKPVPTHQLFLMLKDLADRRGATAAAAGPSAEPRAAVPAV